MLHSFHIILFVYMGHTDKIPSRYYQHISTNLQKTLMKYTLQFFSKMTSSIDENYMIYRLIVVQFIMFKKNKYTWRGLK